MLGNSFGEIFCWRKMWNKRRSACEMFRLRGTWKEINPPTPAGISHCEAIFHAKRISQIPKGIYFVEKSTLTGAFFWRRWRDSNPRTVLPVNWFRVSLVTTTSIHLHVPCHYTQSFGKNQDSGRGMFIYNLQNKLYKFIDKKMWRGV